MKATDRTVPFCIIFLILSMLIQLFGFGIAYGGVFGSPVPKGKEMKDPYLEKLFAPEFPYESINIVDTEEGKRYLIIKAKDKVTGERRIDYEKNTLRKRGIVVYRSGSPRTDTLLISEMRLYRVVSEVPYVVEYSEVIGKQLEGKNDVESVVRDDGKYLIVLIDKQFGKIFKKVEIYPEKETKCPDPPFVGKYPNSKTISCTGGDKGILFVYVTKDKGQQVYDYYKDRLKTHYKNVGFNFPEKAWKFDDEFGIQIKSFEVAHIGLLLDQFNKKPSIVINPPPQGVVFHIVIYQVGFNPVVRDFSFITIFYSLNNEKIKANIDQMKVIYPEGVK